MEIKFRDHRIGGNPFDVILQASIAYTRAMLFNIKRYRGGYAEPNWSEYLTEKIAEQVKILDTMSDEEVELCRKNSVLLKYCNQDVVNQFLFDIENNIPTIWSESNPAYSDDLEKLFLGEESSDYLKRKSLVSLVDEMMKMKQYHDAYELNDFLKKCVNALDSAVRQADKDDEAIQFVKEYSLNMDDIDFMRSLTKHMGNDEDKTFEKLFNLMNTLNVR